MANELYTLINLTTIGIAIMLILKGGQLHNLKAKRYFTGALVSMVVFMLSDNVAYLANQFLDQGAGPIMLIAKYTYFLSTTVMCFHFFWLFESIRNTRLMEYPGMEYKTSVIVWLEVGFMVANYFQGIFFYIDSNNVYQRGPIFSLQYGFAYIYVFVAVFRAIWDGIHQDFYVDKANVFSYALFTLFPGMAGIVQFFRPEIPVAAPALAISSLVFFLNEMDHMVDRDAMTGLHNRRFLMEILQKMMTGNQDKKDVLYLVMIDANSFKEINDTYGHTEGDRALIRIGKAIRNTCTNLSVHSYAARYGGDEFMIALESKTLDDVLAIKSMLNHELSKLNRDENSPVNLTVSVGYTTFGPEIRSVRELIDHADEEMYREKLRMKSLA